MTGHDDGAKSLAHNLLQADITDLIDLTRCDPQNGQEGRFNFCHNREIDKLIESRTMNSMTLVYPMTNSPRGYCLLINNHFTVGTYKEMQRFRNIFYQLHFEVILKKNMNKIDIVNILKEISNRNELYNYDAFVLMIIAHGNEKNEIYGFDSEAIKIRDLMDLMNTKNCPRLISKPKLFFFNCCRGSQLSFIEYNDFNIFNVDNFYLLLNKNFDFTDRAQFDYPNRSNILTSYSHSIDDKLVAMQDEFVCYSTLHGNVENSDKHFKFN